MSGVSVQKGNIDRGVARCKPATFVAAGGRASRLEIDANSTCSMFRMFISSRRSVCARRTPLLRAISSLIVNSRPFSFSTIISLRIHSIRIRKSLLPSSSLLMSLKNDSIFRVARIQVTTGNGLDPLTLQRNSAEAPASYREPPCSISTDKGGTAK